MPDPDQGIQEFVFGEYAVRVGHGDCHECDVDLGWQCEDEYQVHWCRRHSALESE